MKNRILKAFLAAAGTAACGAAGYAAGRKEKTEPSDRPGSASGVSHVKDVSGGKNMLTEDKVRRCLLNLFWMYDYDEFWHFRDCSCDDSDLRDCAAGYYAPVLYRFMKKNMKTVFKLEGSDGTGQEPFDISDRLFIIPACRICSGPQDMVFDRFELILSREIWILEDGRTASVYCLDFERDGHKLVYRFLDKYIRMPGDISVSFEELEDGLIRMGAADRDENGKML